MTTKRYTPSDLIAMKHKRQRITALTAYDYTSAQMLDRAGIQVLLVGDTVGMVVQGQDTTLPVTLEQIIYHARMVVRGAPRAMVIADMPFLTYQVNSDEAIRNAGRLMQEAGVGAIKLEGGADMAPIVRRMVKAGIPVCAHLGYTPQSTHTLGGPRVQGKALEDAQTLVEDAKALADAGAFAIVLELVPSSLAAEVSRRVKVPTIGIGAGAECDGEIQVFHDLFGLYTDFKPRHTKRYANVAEQITAAAEQYRQDVEQRVFPGREQSSDLPAEERRRLTEHLNRTCGSVDGPVAVALAR
ncbi:MAG: 3-methyl-2-oxobutanoate hydroxymethyltransferase [Ectothiorhodospiraceae bacterium]|nr:3-methyl-2-oxobutanoate hydroxymethyltransferase [Ectothiorhodospiraceae bacterium]MCH8503276.1 3-methyl-2-oxobutanoate hydroxymethyltransferase [Ectothiorhodospiraceae bacterium]